MYSRQITWLLSLLLLVTTTWAWAQDAAPQDWFHLDFQQDGVPGISTNRAYNELLNGKQNQTVVVAVIDSGVDFDHQDLRDNMWVNSDEIPGNGIDDDRNGYIDDIHGWNFLGNANGNNIHYENLEVVRIYNRLQARFAGISDPSNLSKSDRADYNTFQEYGQEIESKRTEMGPNVQLYAATLGAFDGILKAMGKTKKEVTLADINAFRSTDEMLTRASRILKGYMEQGETFASIYDQVKEVYDYYNQSYNYNWNPEFDARSIIGDDPSNLRDRNYGNGNVEGPDATHGTHVAGIIGAVRNNGLGMDGVAANVRIMSIRTVPDGDERDKDVANAIRYAVDNGAQVINMSFGKGASPYKAEVDDAIRYAIDRDVLLIHGAGNDGKELTYDNNFPNDRYNRAGLFAPKYAEAWIEVGATTWNNNAELTADFSNYSADKVDVFAPGVQIYSTVPNDEYKNLQGTSMAAPMVAGLAALLRSYFPDLTAPQVKDIIMQSTVRYQERVNEPGETGNVVAFTRLAVTGGVVNVYNAVNIAKRTRGKKKRTAPRDPALAAQ